MTKHLTFTLLLIFTLMLKISSVVADEKDNTNRETNYANELRQWLINRNSNNSSATLPISLPTLDNTPPSNNQLIEEKNVVNEITSPTQINNQDKNLLEAEKLAIQTLEQQLQTEKQTREQAEAYSKSLEQQLQTEKQTREQAEVYSKSLEQQLQTEKQAREQAEAHLKSLNPIEKLIPTPQVTIDNNKVVSAPKIISGDYYIYENQYIGDSESKIRYKKIVKSIGKEIAFSTINITEKKKSKEKTVYFNQEWNLLHVHNTNGSKLLYSPPLKYYDFPLYPGKNWREVTVETDSKTRNKRIYTVQGNVEGWEYISVPAGNFYSLKVVLEINILNPQTQENSISKDTSWYVPEVKRSVQTVNDYNEKQKLIRLIEFSLNN